ncbi:MAG: HAD family phosphatase [Candidatus Woesebacteria bacterium]|jgi:epoxide hydrolase-like predicted phosphatase
MRTYTPKAIIFDAFDTLISDGVRIAAERMTRKLNLSDTNEFWSKIPSWQKNWKNLWLGKINEEKMRKMVSDEIGKEIAEKFYSLWKSETKSNPDMISLVEEIKKRDTFKLALLANTPPLMFEYIKKQVPLALFNVVIASCEVGLMKPDEKIYKLLLKKLNVEPNRCLLIDDRKDNLTAADKLGMNTIHFENYGLLLNRLKSLLNT